MIKMESPDIPLGRVGHILGMYKHKIICLGERLFKDDTEYLNDVIQVFNPVTNHWNKIECTGAIPEDSLAFSPAKIIGSNLYVVVANMPSAVYVLDLESYCWKKLVTSGVPPLAAAHSSAWVWKEKIYLFGGRGLETGVKHLPQPNIEVQYTQGRLGITMYNGQFVAFNTSSNTWEWPNWSGCLPGPRAAHKCIVTGDYMIMFGGFDSKHTYNELYSLHMPTHKWSLLNNSPANGSRGIPPGRHCHAFIRVSETCAVVHGGEQEHKGKIFSDTWVLEWSFGRSEITDIKWTRKTVSVETPRALHEAEYSPEASSLYFFGGCDNFDWHRWGRKFSDKSGTFSLLIQPVSLRKASAEKYTEWGYWIDCLLGSSLGRMSIREKPQAEAPDMSS